MKEAEGMGEARARGAALSYIVRGRPEVLPLELIGPRKCRVDRPRTVRVELSK